MAGFKENSRARRIRDDVLRGRCGQSRCPRFGHLKLFCPDDEGEDFVPAAKIPLVDGDFTVTFDTLAPLLGVIKIGLVNFFGQVAANCLPKSGETIKMGINEAQFFVVMSVGVLVSVWVTGIVHAGAEIGIVKILILVIEAESVADFLADDHLPPGGSIVRSGIEISVIHLGNALGNVRAGNPDLGDAQPAIVAVL